MAEASQKPSPSRHERIPFWRDIRVLGILAQLAFLALVVVGAVWLFNNVTENLLTLGENQFRCADGTTSIGCAFDFLSNDAAFDIAETTIIDYEPSDSYGQALVVGLLNTVRVTVIGIILATILGTIAGIARLSSNWLIANIAKWYVDLMRNTPLLLILFFLFFGVILAFPSIELAIQPLGLPIFLSQRGISLPSPVFMPSSSTWLAFLLLALVQAQVVWIILGRREERTGKSSNRPFWVVVSFLLVIGVGWFVSSANADNQGMLVARALRVREIGDLEEVMLRRLGVENLHEVDAAISSGELTPEAVDEAAFTICAVEDSPSEINLTSQLRSANIPYVVDRADRIDQATEAYGAGECEIFVHTKETLAAERSVLENGSDQLVVHVPETPVRIDVPRIEGLNFVGGLRLTPNFAAILIGLVIYTGAFIAEIVRAGIQSVTRGQTEAARALGLSESQRLRLVVLPQALRVIIPPLTSQYLNLAKNSSLAIAVGFADLWSVSFTTLNQSGRSVQVFLIVMAFYLSLSLIISFILNWYNKRIALVER